MHYVLLVTLIVVGQPPYSYEVEFVSSEQCLSAQRNVIASYETNFSKANLSYSILCLQRGQ